MSRGIILEEVEFAYTSGPAIPPGGEDEGRMAVRGISGEIPPGQFLVLIGPNGSGKSTLARLLNGLLTPTRGSVRVDGLDTRDPRDLREIRRRVGMVFQNPDNQLVASTVEEDVAFGPENLGIPQPELGRRVRSALARVGMAGYEKAQTHTLSGGQKQRVAIAGVLAMEPEVLVLDEPTSLLDPVGRREVVNTVTELHRSLGITVIWITHSMEEACRAERVWLLGAGRLWADGPPAEVFSRTDLLERWGLRSPAAVAVTRGLRAAGVSLPTGIITGDELVAELAARFPAGLASRAGEGTAGGPCESGVATGRVAAGEGKAGGSGPIIRAEHLGHVYAEPGGRRLVALEDVSFTVQPGERIAVVGATGSGKSTLVQHLNGLLFPTSGGLVVFDYAFGELAKGVRRPPKDQGLRKLRGRVGLVFQFPEDQLFAETVAEDVAFGPRNLGLDEDEVARRVRQALAQVGMEAELIAGRSPLSLSGGERRRVALAGVLAMEPEVLVLDEPTVGLDPQGREALIGLLDNLASDGRHTLVAVTHDMDLVARLTSRVLVLSAGRLVFDGTPRALFATVDQEKMSEWGLVPPEPVALMAELRRRGFPVRSDCLTVAEATTEIVRALEAGRELV